MPIIGFGNVPPPCTGEPTAPLWRPTVQFSRHVLLVCAQSPLDRPCIDRIILSVRTHKPNIHHAIGVVDPNDDSVFVSRDVEHGPAVLQNTHRPDVPLHVGWRFPIRGSDLPYPGHYGIMGVSIAGASPQKGLERAHRDDSHHDSLPWSHRGTKPNP